MVVEQSPDTGERADQVPEKPIRGEPELPLRGLEAVSPPQTATIDLDPTRPAAAAAARRRVLLEAIERLQP
jgi:hypothetical protein